MKPKDRASKPDSNQRLLLFGICLFLVAIVFLVYGQTLRFPFVNFDDDRYVYENTTVAHGLTISGAASAFSTRGTDNWIPLTALSHMLDCQWYGLKAGGHHLTNVLLHAAAAIILFLALYRMTRAPWRSAFVASLFAIHPMGVESVAWISERKDVLSGLFFMMTLLAYAGYVRNPKSWWRYLAALAFAALGLMSKPMLVTLPFILLLLDYWPLNRFASPTAVTVQIILEKVPFLALSCIACVMTFFMQQATGTVNALGAIPMSLRIENAFVSYACYLGKIFWPENLAVLYPLPAHWPWWLVLCSIALVLVLCAGAFLARTQYPYVLTGWCWFAGMLVPVIGVVQVGSQAMADRYVYLPQIGLYLLFTWLVAEWSVLWKQRQVMLAGLSVITLSVLIYRADAQVSYWSDSQKLWKHALASSPEDLWTQSAVCYAMAHNNLGSALMQDGQTDGAIAQFRDALNMDPDDAAAYYNLGNALVQNGRMDEAIPQFRQALKLNPDNADAYHNLVSVFMQEGRLDEAAAQLREGMKLGLTDAENSFNLGNAFLQAGRVDEAIAQYQQALQVDPANVAAHGNLGAALLQTGRVDEAIVQYQEALKIQPDNVVIQNNFARIIWAFATSPDASLRNGRRALELATAANGQAGGNNPVILRVLAAAEAEMGDFSDALATVQQALALASKEQNSALVNALQQEISLYQAGKPVRSNASDLAGWQ